jgi:hypothetical protein
MQASSGRSSGSNQTPVEQQQCSSLEMIANSTVLGGGTLESLNTRERSMSRHNHFEEIMIVSKESL